MGKSERQKLQGGPNTSKKSKTPEVPPGSHSEYWRKIPKCFWQGEEKQNHYEIFQSILFFLTRSVLRKKVLNQSFLGFFRA